MGGTALTDADIQHIREGIEALKVAVAIHDSKVESSVAALKDTQDRIADAIEKVGGATVAIERFVEHMKPSPPLQQTIKTGNGTVTIDPKTFKWLIGAALLGAMALGGGQAVAERIITAIMPH